MTSQLQFAGKVVVVTGAGGGLGRQYAIQFAQRGAALVVNDLGGSRDDEGKNVKAADLVVDEIKSTGGKAVADYNSVEDGHKIVQTAIDQYGKVDVVVNNAGIVRDCSFMKMSQNDWDAVHNVHLRGSFMVTKAAWPYLRKQNFGKVIFTSSAVAMFGNFGQANYSAAKMGLVGLCKTLAIEGAKYNISCNTIIPTAVSKMTENLLPSDIHKFLNPKYVAPLVLWLSHDSCVENGGIYEAGAGWLGKYDVYRSKGINCLENDELTPEKIAQNWSQVTDMSEAGVLDGIHSQISSLLSSIPKKSNTLSQIFKYTPREMILYAISIGCKVENTDDLKFLYENHDKFSFFPSFGVLPSIDMVVNRYDDVYSLIAARLPNIEFEMAQILHGEHYMEILKPLSVEGGKITSTLEIVDVLDKKSGIVVILNIKSNDENDDQIIFNQLNLFIREGGGYGGPKTSDGVYPIVSHPERKPDFEVTHYLDENMAALYRLTGDRNPIHIDPEIANSVGFSKPIAHGLCTLGIATRQVLEKFGENNPSRFKCIKARFSSAVTPGDTITTKMWNEAGRVHFIVESTNADNRVITGAYVDLAPKNSGDGLLKSTAIFEALDRKVKNENVDVNAVFQWNVTMNSTIIERWILNLGAEPSVYSGECQTGVADCVLTCEDSLIVSMMNGELNPTTAYMQGSLKIDGNVMLSQKLSSIFKPQSKL